MRYKKHNSIAVTRLTLSYMTPDGVILSGAAFQAERRISRAGLLARESRAVAIFVLLFTLLASTAFSQGMTTGIMSPPG